MEKSRTSAVTEQIREVIKGNIHSDIGTCYTPKEPNRFLAKLATNIPVARELISEGKLPLEPLDQSLAALALSDFLRSCITPVRDTEESRNFTNPSVRQPRERLNTCRSAEESFEAVFSVMKVALDEKGAHDEPKWTLVVDGTGAPIAIQKGITVKSGLTLAPITIDGCIIAVGSLVDIGFFYEQDGIDLPKAVGLVTSFDSIETMDFLRLSDFAYMPEGGNLVDGAQSSTEISSPLKEYIELAEKCIPLCARI